MTDRTILEKLNAATSFDDQKHRVYCFLWQLFNPLDSQLNSLLRRSKGAVVTGSSALWWLLRPEHRSWTPRDLDIFKVNEGDVDEKRADSISTGLQELGWRHAYTASPYDHLCFVSNQWKHDQFPELTINIVTVDAAQTVDDLKKHILKVFDFDVCQIMFDGFGWYYQAHEAITNRLITVNPQRFEHLKCQSDWFILSDRIQRYRDRGFHFTNAERCREKYFESARLYKF